MTRATRSPLANEDARTAFVERLRARRIGLGLHLAVVAERVGVHRMTVHRWEAGRTFPRPERAQAWADALGVRVVGGSLDDLFRVPCGTPRGYKRHRERGERCPQCWAAWSAYNTAAYTPTPRKVDLHRDAVVELLSRGRSAAAIARELGIPGSTARLWASKLRPQAVSTVVDGSAP